MARMNSEYGSELHLLRMLGRHREYFSREVCHVTGAEHVDWLDFPSGEKRFDRNGNVLWDVEWQKFEFLPPSDPALAAWQRAWPTRGTGHNWDAIGRARFGATSEWLLVEAKANVEEIISECQAADPASRAMIEATLNETKASLGVAESCDWKKPYYQFCNRLAALRVLNTEGTPSRLLYVYFCGDVGDQRRTCPESKEAWQAALAKQDEHVELPAEHALRGRIHKLFIDVQCRQ